MNRSPRVTQVKIAISIVLGLCASTHLQASPMPLADVVPGDAVAYVGWAGADPQSAVYRSSQLSAFIDHSNLPELARQYVPKLWDQLAGQGGDPKVVTALQKALPILWRHPTAVYTSAVIISADGMPRADFGLISDAGSDAGELKADLQAVLAGADRVKVAVKGTLVSVTFEGSMDHAPGPMLAANPRFVSTMKALQAAPSIAVYVDLQSILQKADESAAKESRASEAWPKVRDALGIGKMKSFAMTAGFDGGDWMTTSRLEAPGPRTGLLSVIEPQQIDPVLLARIPATAGSVSVYNFDTAKLFDTLAQAMAASKESDTLFHQVSGAATVVLGRNLRRQVLGPLGPQWVMYSDSTQHSAVLMNHTSDADTTSDAMVSAVFGLVNLANAQIPAQGGKPVTSADQKRVKGLDLTSAVTAMVSPTVAVKDKVLYWGLSVDSVVVAANTAAVPSSNDLLHSADFLAAKKKLGVNQMSSFDYCDLPKTAPAAYANFGAEGDQVRQMLSMLHMDLPRVQLPPLEQLAPHLSPSLDVSWSDADGIYSKSICPFPGSAELLGDPQQAMVTASATTGAVAVVAPALSRARTQARAVRSMANERQIVLGLMMYANDNHGKLPKDFGSIITRGYLGSSAPMIFLQPDSKMVVSPEIVSGTREEQAAWVNDHAEYVLLPLAEKRTQIREPSRTAIVVPVNADQATEPLAVGFVDGHCEMCKPDRVKHLLHLDEPANP